MVWSLLARRLTLGAVGSVAVRAAHPATLSIVTRRTLFATPQFNFPPAKASPSTAKTTRKTAEKDAPKVPARRGRPPKTAPKSSQGKKLKAEPKKQRVRVPKSLKPPKRAPGPYFLFYASFVKSQPRASTLPEFQEFSRRAGEIWRGYSMAEKQPFYDENEGRKAQAKQERDEFFRNTSLSDLKQLNAIRKAQGKTKFHLTKKPSIPVTPFILFSNEFRGSPEGQAIIEETSPEKRYTVRAVLAAAGRWRSMSTEEKAPYFERYKKAKEELKASAEHVES
ncbi:hypothetical protein JVT61DRAFT_7117 [Boletus reticuloceps]|uniref:HMG box domain-containing protein n=1 Tax=Boletus reticuloceps TaxID=495285 RepID=A0A8I3A7J1_9AGAM|nr:hypothetical protein JVT61DRAFT_7117 [Boletus reticuloceps]